ncbi:hypothetical protein SAMN05878249_1512 [Vreelandella aquamarina]|jgi:hypothetical protein|uniref:Uncharacterized protein n=1 Tax=Vreelandella aquamarina TaxID=77097 RepID=A0A1N6DPX3_9GAMM|nr:hypothetical protein SAMN05878249_1512 [Halomonas meridiana]SIN72724.1 hypothetical protein SAMN05878438_2947 [Halomonas meridiana]SIO41654.1 hypothetical protein SAMN05878442_3095 [Halomonas meridiana]
MDETTKHKALLEEVLQPRNDYLGIEAIKPLLVQTIESYCQILCMAGQAAVLSD